MYSVAVESGNLAAALSKVEVAGRPLEEAVTY